MFEILRFIVKSDFLKVNPWLPTMIDQPYPDPSRPTIDDLDPEMVTTDRLIAMVRSHREGGEYHYKCRFFHVSSSSIGNDKISGDMDGAGQGSGQPWPRGNG